MRVFYRLRKTVKKIKGKRIYFGVSGNLNEDINRTIFFLVNIWKFN